MRASWYGNKTKGLHTFPFLYPKGLKVCKPGLQEAVAVILRMDEKGYLLPPETFEKAP